MLEESRRHREMIQERIQKSFESEGLNINSLIKGEENEIFKAQEIEEQEVSVTDLIKAGVLEYDDSIEKAVYADTYENRKLGRVGQEYHRGKGKKVEDERLKTPKKEQNISNKKNKKKENIFKYFPETKNELRHIIAKKNINSNNIDLNDVDVSKISDLSFLFDQSPDANPDVSNWDVSHVTNMRGLFSGCHNFEGKGLENWDVSNVTDMSGMFDGCEELKKIPSWYKTNNLLSKKKAENDKQQSKKENIDNKTIFGGVLDEVRKKRSGYILSRDWKNTLGKYDKDKLNSFIESQTEKLKRIEKHVKDILNSKDKYPWGVKVRSNEQKQKYAVDELKNIVDHEDLISYAKNLLSQRGDESQKTEDENNSKISQDIKDLVEKDRGALFEYFNYGKDENCSEEELKAFSKLKKMGAKLGGNFDFTEYEEIRKYKDKKESNGWTLFELNTGSTIIFLEVKTKNLAKWKM
jgi:surface protein